MQQTSSLPSSAGLASPAPRNLRSQSTQHTNAQTTHSPRSEQQPYTACRSLASDQAARPHRPAASRHNTRLSTALRKQTARPHPLPQLSLGHAARAEASAMNSTMRPTALSMR